MKRLSGDEKKWHLFEYFRQRTVHFRKDEPLPEVVDVDVKRLQERTAVGGVEVGANRQRRKGGLAGAEV